MVQSVDRRVPGTPFDQVLLEIGRHKQRGFRLGGKPCGAFQGIACPSSELARICSRMLSGSPATTTLAL